MQRRNFFKYSLVLSTLLLQKNLSANTLKSKFKKSPTIVICGGGFAGLSAGKYLKELNSNLNVIIIEQNKQFISCPLSNGYLGALKEIPFDKLVFDYNSAVGKYKYSFVNETILKIDKNKKTVTTENSLINYDYLVMAVGVDYNYKKLFKKDKEKAKEAYLKAPPGLKPGSEHLKLKRMINNFKGGNFVITLPSQQYKCPSAPYERACMIANYFKNNNIDGKVIIIDPRSKPSSKSELFLEAFNTLYKDIIIYKNLTNFKDVDFKKKTITAEHFNKKTFDYEKETITFEEASIIPANIANRLIKKAKLKTYAQGFAKLQKPTFRSVSSDIVYIIGDSQGEYPYPKSAQMANSQALLVAQDLDARIKGLSFDYTKNMPANICYSLIDNTKAISITHFYEYNNKIDVSYETSKIDTHTKEAALIWYDSLTKDIFGI